MTVILHEQSVHQNDDQASQHKRPRPDISAMMLLLGAVYSQPRNQFETVNEADKYWMEPNVGLKQDPMDGWKLNSHRFPRIAELAKQYLCVPATSAPSERVFFTTGVVVNRLCTHLSPQHVDMIVFLCRNYHDYDNYNLYCDNDDLE